MCAHWDRLIRGFHWDYCRIHLRYCLNTPLRVGRKPTTDYVVNESDSVLCRSRNCYEWSSFTLGKYHIYFIYASDRRLSTGIYLLLEDGSIFYRNSNFIIGHVGCKYFMGDSQFPSLRIYRKWVFVIYHLDRSHHSWLITRDSYETVCSDSYFNPATRTNRFGSQYF